jgi:hypothetical protein
MSDNKWSFRIDVYNGVSVFRDGTLYSGCAAQKNNFNDNAKRSIKFLCELGKDVHGATDADDKELSDMLFTAVIALLQRFD